MSLENPEKIDVAGIDKATGEVMLTIIDHWDWDDEYNHLMSLQEKINKYIEYYESGQIVENFPDYKSRTTRIQCIFKYDITENAQKFIKSANATVAPIGLSIIYEINSGY